jgi:hydroxymethylpyrimidine/phosphomethylpyrimidine kinase
VSARKAVLIVAGSDSSGGAGLARDLQVLKDFDVDALCAVTAVTAQSNTRTGSIHHVPADLVREQIAAAFATGPIHAIKIGMLGTAATAEAVVAGIAHSTVPLVLDPVLAASSGGVLLDEPGIAAMRRLLLPRTTLFTPNIPEAAVLLQEAAAGNIQTMVDQARRLLQLGPQSVMLKGGHASDEQAIDVLVQTNADTLQLASRRSMIHQRGTGCTLATAAAASLACGATVEEACRAAKQYVAEWLLSTERRAVC